MAARKKTKRKTRKRAGAKRAPRRRAAPAKATSPGDLVLKVARQMADVVERGLKRTMAKLPTRAATGATRQRLKDAIAALRRQADSLREQAQSFEARGSEAVAAVWRGLGERVEHAAAQLGHRLGR
jgi:hypothetical protein